MSNRSIDCIQELMRQIMAITIVRSEASTVHNRYILYMYMYCTVERVHIRNLK